MPRPADPTPSHGRQHVVLRARPNLAVTPLEQQGRRAYVVKDPVSLGYFHLDESQKFLLDRMDGRRTLEDLRRDFETEFRPRRLSAEEVETFAAQLLRNGLVESEAAAPGAALARRAAGQHARPQGWWLAVLYFKLPLLNPDRLLEAPGRACRPLFQPASFALGLLAVLAAGLLVLGRWDEFVAALPAYQSLFTWRTLLTFWVLMGVVKTLHELGHALCAKAHGAAVREAGVVFLFLFPTLYCDVTDGWTIPRKWRRIAVSAAGVWVELLIAAAAAVVWWGADAHGPVSALALALVLVCGVNTLAFNGNPLMRFDGYFILADWLEVPNLAQTAQRQLRDVVLRWLAPENVPTAPAHNSRLLAAYAAASGCYRAFVTVGMGAMVYAFLKEQGLPWVGAALVAAGALGLLAPHLATMAAWLRLLGGGHVRRARLWTGVGLASSLVLAVATIPLPLNVRGVGLVEVAPERRARLAAPAPGGFLDQLLVRDGQRVRMGDVLAVFRNPELERRVRLNEAEQVLLAEQQQALESRLAWLPAARGDASRHGELAHDRRALAQQQTALRAQLAALTLRAPLDGTVLHAPSWDAAGRWLAEGEDVFTVGDDRALRAVVLVDPADQQLVEAGKPSRFLPHGGGPVLAGAVTDVARVDAPAVPPRLSARAGGEVATRHDPTSGAERPYQQHFVVTLLLDDTAGRLQPGQLGEVRIEAGSATLWWRCKRAVATTFRGP